MSTLDKRERVRRTLALESVDRPPVTLWWHEFLAEWDLRALEDATVASYRRFDWDLVKLNPRGTYFAEAWGAAFEPPTAEAFPRQLVAPVRASAVLGEIEPVDPTGGVLGEHLELLARVVGRVGSEVDVIHTVFSPLGILGMLCGPPDGTAAPKDAVQAFGEGQRTLLMLAEAAPAAVHRALSVICDTIAAYSEAAVACGAAGLFYAPMTWTSRRVCSETFYAEFGRPYDLAILARVQRAPCNVLHVCGNDNMLDSMLDYPVPVVNWADDGVGNASLADVLVRSPGKAVMGGADPAATRRATADEARTRMATKLARDTRGLFVGGGCAMWPGTPHENFAAIREAVREARTTPHR